jgi:hypothetical protein
MEVKNTPIQQQSFVECSYEKATVFKLNDKVFSIHGQTASKTSTGVSLRMQFDRWADFDLQDFQIIGIKCFEVEQEKPIEFVGEVISLNLSVSLKLSGRHMDSELYIKAPPGSKGKKFRCVEIDDKDWHKPLTYHIHYNNRRGDPQFEPYFYIKDSNGYIHPEKFKSSEDAQKMIDIWNY